jgi:uncharacterized membrane protein
MKTLSIVFHRETRSPLLALLFASVMGVGLVGARIALTRNFNYSYLIWNLFLAWVPMVLALLCGDRFRRGEHRTWRFAALAAAWLLFFPNAPYIFTDFIHLVYGHHQRFWVDLTLILMCALTGLVLGFVSLYLMQSIVRRLYGQVASWLFVLVVAGLSGFGIYLGRFVRLNSWHVVTRPMKLYQGVADWAANPLASSTTFTFPLLFATFILLAYVMLYALTHLPKPQDAAAFTPQRTAPVA